ncbi:MAG: hypothetical protein KJ770_01815 [Actinobacteria bacterium]|nr:hypothetical protein [Actinomycetota bacterium]
MEKDVEKFLQAEESAEKLIQTLEKLQTEAKSYQGATNELGVVRNKLLELIESTKDVASNSYEVIKTLKDIGGPEIFERFTKLESKLDGSAKSIEDSLDERFTKIENKLEETSNKQSSRIKNLKLFLIILLLISLATIAGLVFPKYLVELNNFFYNIFK